MGFKINTKTYNRYFHVIPVDQLKELLARPGDTRPKPETSKRKVAPSKDVEVVEATEPEKRADPPEPVEKADIDKVEADTINEEIPAENHREEKGEPVNPFLAARLKFGQTKEEAACRIGISNDALTRLEKGGKLLLRTATYEKAYSYWGKNGYDIDTMRKEYADWFIFQEEKRRNTPLYPLTVKVSKAVRRLAER